MLDKTDISWLAGLVDGEGSFSISIHKDKNRKRCLWIRPRFAMCMYYGNGEWSKRVSYILNNLKINHCNVSHKANNRPSHIYKESYCTISIQGKEHIRNLCKILIPFLTIKKDRAKLLSTWPQKRLIFVVTQTGRVIKNWDNINEVIRYVKKTRELNRGYHHGKFSYKWTPENILKYFQNLT